jgi:2,3-bisphosphoglycerate-independent phosphoglycerate mutase
VVFRGSGLSDRIEETDPQKVGHMPKEPAPLSSEAERTSRVVKQFIDRARELLKEREPANFVLLRGFAKSPEIPSLSSLYKMKTAAIATYPMYRGLAKLVGMDVLKTGETVSEEFECLRAHYADYDFFYVHIKHTDKAGEDGDSDRKRQAIEEVDEKLTTVRELEPDCLVVTADHSTPCKLASHSWHPNPVLLVSRFGGVDEVTAFTERECAKGGLGRMPAKVLMGLMLANTLRLKKFGA